MVRFAVCGTCGSRAVSVRRSGQEGVKRCSCASCGHVALVRVLAGDRLLPGYRQRGYFRTITKGETVRERPTQKHQYIPCDIAGQIDKARRYSDLVKEPWAYSLKCRCGKHARILDAGRCEERPEVWSIHLACRHCRSRFHIFKRSEKMEVTV